MSSLSAPLQPAHALNPQVTPQTSAAIEKAMQLDAGSRFRSATEFKAAISAGAAAPAVKPTAKRRGANQKLPLRRPYLLIPLVILLGLATLPLIINLFSSMQTTRAPVATATEWPTVLPTATPDPATPTIPPQTTDTVQPVLEPGAIELSPRDGMEMIFIPAGEFVMGATEVEAGLNFDQTPQHTVALSAYWIDRFEISNGMYRECVEAGACRAPVTSASSTRKYYFDNPDYTDFPVIWVTWHDAAAYCRWAERRLPSEAEWERAARGDNGLSYYPWGSDLPNGDLANYCDVNCDSSWKEGTVDDGFADTAPVNYFQPGASVYGLYNMAGNVWEWVFDFYDKNFYHLSPFENPIGPGTGNERVLRGGSFENSAQDIRAVNRFYFSQDAATSSFGFRCAADLR